MSPLPPFSLYIQSQPNTPTIKPLKSPYGNKPKKKVSKNKGYYHEFISMTSAKYKETLVLFTGPNDGNSNNLYISHKGYYGSNAEDIMMMQNCKRNWTTKDHTLLTQFHNNNIWNKFDLLDKQLINRLKLKLFQDNENDGVTDTNKLKVLEKKILKFTEAMNKILVDNNINSPLIQYVIAGVEVTRNAKLLQEYISKFRRYKKSDDSNIILYDGDAEIIESNRDKTMIIGYNPIHHLRHVSIISSPLQNNISNTSRNTNKNIAIPTPESSTNKTHEPSINNNQNNNLKTKTNTQTNGFNNGFNKVLIMVLIIIIIIMQVQDIYGTTSTNNPPPSPTYTLKTDENELLPIMYIYINEIYQQLQLIDVVIDKLSNI